MTIFLIGCALLLPSVLTRGYDIFASDVLSHTFKIVPVLFVVGQMVLFLLAFVYQSNVHQKARLLIEIELRESLSKLEYFQLKLGQRIHDQNETVQKKFSDEVTPYKLSESKFNDLLITPLSSREQEVLLHVSRGLSNQETADLLFISINTVKTHLLRIYEKLDVKNRTEAAIRAGEMNLLN
ncbi:MAG: response regulator transcription factor [Crocinitomicaceae bacterium]